MRWGTSGRIAALVLVMGCHADFVSDDPIPIAKVSPANVSTTSAWSLFDRSIESRFAPTGEAVRVMLDRVEQISSIKVYGSAPYRLRATGPDGSTLGFPPIDLAAQSPGWHAFPASALAGTNVVELHFEGSGGEIPELELWALDDGSVSTADLSKPDLPDRFVTLPPDTKSAELAPSECATFDVAITRSPAELTKAHLVFDAEGLVGSFSLHRSINGRAEQGGSWLGGDASARTIIDRFDPAALTLGKNAVQLCVPNDASRGVAITNLRIVGELDPGTELATAISIGDAARDGAALLDPQASAVEIAGGERVLVAFDHLIAPDALVLAGAAATDLATVECVDGKGTAQPIASSPRAVSSSLFVELGGGASSCAALAFTLATTRTLSHIRVVGSGASERVDWPQIVITSAPDHFGDTAWVGGFVARPPAMTGAIRTLVADRPSEVMTGDFGQLLHRGREAAVPWPVTVTAKLPDGTTQAKQIVLDRDRRALLSIADATPQAAAKATNVDAAFGHAGQAIVVRATKLAPATIRLGTQVGVDVPAGAVHQATDITVRHLLENALPPLDPGMINVTAPGGKRGYEFLPHGQHFAKPVEVVLPYDPALIPEGMTPDDVHAYFYDPKAERWKQLDRNAIDVGAHVTRSSSGHFTIMINAVLTVPKNPSPLSFDPTALTSIGAASPATNIDLISAPQANATGDARLSLPIRVPTGRGYTPSLSMNYSNANANGWLGVGWDLQTSRIEIDTRWGVPTYGASERPRYLLDGAELVPTGETDGPGCASGAFAGRYRARIEGAFEYIVRCGTSPSDYHWEVRDRDGTRMTYGTGNAALASYRAPQGIFRWQLAEVVDVHANKATFGYQLDEITGLGIEPSRELYLASIAYTSHPAKPEAPYHITFELDNGLRPDRIVSGRAGFKMVTRHLLRAVRVTFRGDTIRDYVLTYTHGQFGKSVLQSVRVYGTTGCTASGDAFHAPACADSALFHEHGFEYYAEPETFSDASQLGVNDDPQPDRAALGKGESGDTSLSAGVTYGDPEGSHGSLAINGSFGGRRELVGVYDVNGDGLVDQVFDVGGALTVLYNQSRPDGGLANPLFAATPPTTALLLGLGQEQRGSWGGDISASGGGFSVSGGFSSATTKATKFVTELDGDGFMDVVMADGTALFGAPCAQGLCFNEGRFGAVTAIDPRSDPVLNNLEQDLRSRLPVGDPVVQWVAPFDGTITVFGRVVKPNAGTGDGVTVEAYLDDTLIDSLAIPAGNTSLVTFPQPTSLEVTAGQAVYLRVKSGADDGTAADGSPADKIDTDLDVSYLQPPTGLSCGAWDPNAHEPTGRPVFSYSSDSDDFRVAGKPVPAIATADGTLQVRALLVKQPSLADVRVCVQRFASLGVVSDVAIDRPCSATGPDVTNVSGTIPFAAGTASTLPLVTTIAVHTGEYVVVRVESDLSFDPANVSLAPLAPGLPLVGYTEVCLPSIDGSGTTCSTDPHDLEHVAPLAKGFGPFVVVPDQAPAIPLVARGGTLHVTQFLPPLGPYIFAIRSDRHGILFVRDCANQECSTTPFPDLAVEPGESVSFELVTGSLPGSSCLFVSEDGNFEVAQLAIRPLHPAPIATPFAGGYRRFRVAFWNEAEPFEPARLIADLTAPGSPENLSQNRLDQIARTLILAEPSFGGSALTGGEPAWFGPSSEAFASSSSMNAAMIGLVFGDDSGTTSGSVGGLYSKNYARISATTAFFLGASTNLIPIPGFSFDISASGSWTKTTTDVVDMTGDGIADVVAPHDVIIGALTAAASQRLSGFDVSEELRYRTGHEYSIGFGESGSVLRLTTSGGRTLSVDRDKGPERGFLGLSAGVGIGIGRSQTEKDLIDVNGDGMPDLLRRHGEHLTVQLNLGDRFGIEEPFGDVADDLRVSIDGFQDTVERLSIPFVSLNSTANALTHETTITQNESGGFSLDSVVDFSHSLHQTSSRITREVADINGDGLPDILLKKHDEPFIRVQLNLGGGFAEQAMHWATTPWPVPLSAPFVTKVTDLAVTGPDVLAGTGSQDSESTHGTLHIPTPIPKLFVDLGGGTSRSTDTYELALMDVDGDGSADHVLRRQRDDDPGTVWVKKNQVTGKANLLKAVHRPLGGTITLDYGRAGNTVDMPHSREVLTYVEVDDGVDLGTHFESPPLVTTMTYTGGVFSRIEKEFFGFAKVTTKRADKVTTEQEFNTSSYAQHGLLLRETRFDSGRRLRQSHALTRELERVLDEHDLPVAPDPDCVAHLHPLLARGGDEACTARFPIVIRDEETRSEDGTTTKTRTIEDTAHDRFGNVLVSLDHADAAIANDDVHAAASYANDTATWILGRIRTLEVRAGSAAGALLRARSGDYNGLGDLIAVHVQTGSPAPFGTATTTLGYDVFGNLTHIETPPNEASQNQTYDVEFDDVTATYPTRTVDAFGYSSSASYDLKFGVATVETDLHGVRLTRTLDPFGRLATVTGPYDPAGSPGLAMSYHLDEHPARAVTITRASAPPDYTGPVPPAITTVTIADGLAQAIEVRKTSVVNGETGMTTSAVVARDAVGRVIRTQNPFFTRGTSEAFAAPDVTEATLTAYDDLDRPVLTTYADGAQESAAFAIEPAPDGTLLFASRAIDPNGHLRETFTDHSGKTRSFVEHPSTSTSSITSYDYLPTGELSQITDAEGNHTELAYDLRGLRTALDNPDTGRITDRFDLMGNRIALQEPNHRVLGVEVHYRFERDRLVGIDYPSMPDVTYTFGPPPSPGAVDFGADRIVRVDDETGNQRHSYGALGEIRRTIRTVNPDKQGSQPIVFDLKLVTDSLGRQLRVGYPDGVVVTNTYDAGGMLASVEGGGSGWKRTYASEIRYDVFGHRSHLRFGNGVETSWEFDPKRVRLDHVLTTLPSAGPTIQDLHYTYDPGSNPTKIVNALTSLSGGSGTLPGDSTLDLTYDGVDRLTSGHGDAQLSAPKRTTYTETFGYSPSHNLLHKDRVHTIIEPGTVPTMPVATNFSSDYTYTSARPHLPTQIGDLLVTYDASGNPTVRRTASTGNQETLVWDDDNRLVDFTSAGVHQHNAFDADGMRVRRKSTQSETLFASEYFDLENGTQGVKHVFAGGTRVASELSKFASGIDQTAPTKQGTAYFFHQDHLQSTTVLTNDAGAVHESTEYFTDGELWIDRGPLKPVNRYLFSGKPFDPDTGFYDFGQRFYEPRTSLWLGVDSTFIDSPIDSLGRPGLMAPLAYAANNPIRFGDPNGQDFIDRIRSGARWVAGVGVGVGKGAWGVAKGGYTLVRHPIRTGEALGHAAAHPVATAEAIGSGIASRARAIASGDPEAVGETLFDIGSIFIGGAAAKGAGEAGALSRVGSVEKVLAVTAETGEAASTAGKAARAASKATGAVEGAGAAGEATGAGDYLIRFGGESESAEKLGADAARAEAAGFPHGVSTRRVQDIRPYKGHRCATCAEVESEFPVTQTGKDPRHHTVVLPKPVTDEVAKAFNRLFRIIE